MSDVVEVGKRETLGLIPNGFLIKTSAGMEYKFTAFAPTEIVGMIQGRLRKNE